MTSVLRRGRLGMVEKEIQELPEQKPVTNTITLTPFLLVGSILIILVFSFYSIVFFTRQKKLPEVSETTKQQVREDTSLPIHVGMKSRIFTLFAIGGTTIQQKLGTPSATASVEYFTSKEQKWKEGPPMAQARSGAGAAVFGNTIYVFGGVTPSKFRLPDGKVMQASQVTNTVEAFGGVSGKWTTKSPIPSPWQLGTVVATNDSIYLIGGWNEVPVSTVFIYNPLTDTWQNGAPVPGRVDTISRNCSPYNKKIYCPEAGESSYTLVYDTTKDTWQQLPSENRSTVQYGRGAEYTGSLFSIYSTPYDSYVSVYDIGKDTLQKSISIPKVRYNFGLTSTSHYLFSVGGRWSNDPYTEVYGVDLYGYPQMNWFSLPSMMHPRSDPAAVTLPVLYKTDKAAEGVLEGTVFFDTNKNKVFDPKEKPAINMPVQLEDASENVNNDVATSFTDEQGKYYFQNLPGGKYHILIEDAQGSGMYRLIEERGTKSQMIILKDKQKKAGLDYGLIY